MTGVGVARKTKALGRLVLEEFPGDEGDVAVANLTRSGRYLSSSLSGASMPCPEASSSSEAAVMSRLSDARS